MRSLSTSLPRAAAIIGLTLGATALAQVAPTDWPAWRGPNGDGTSASSSVPTEWSAEKNVRWKTPMPSWGGGTPIVVGDRIFVTSPSSVSEADLQQFAEDEKERQEQAQAAGRRRRAGRHPGGDQLLLLCLDRTNGDLLWERSLGDGNALHLKSNDSSPSPVSDGTHVWAVSGIGVVKAFTMDGEPVWSVDLQETYGPFGQNWGYASSPVLHNDKLILEVLHGTHHDDPSYIVAFDKLTGDELYRVERPTDAVREAPDAYSTPLIVEHEGATELVIVGGDYVTGHDVNTGKELWRAAGLNPDKRQNYRIVGSPIYANGIIVAPTRKSPMVAVRPGGRGDVTESHTVWTWDGRQGPDVPSPITDGKNLYLVADAGIVQALDLETAEQVWGPERTVRGTVSGSPVLIDGKIYFINEQGVTVIFEAGGEFNMIATNELDGSYTLSSITPAGNELYIRTAEYLYCIANEVN